MSFIIVLGMTPEIQDWVTTPIPQAADPSILELPIEYIFIITPVPTLLFTINGPAFQAWHFMILGILVCAFTYANFDMLKCWMSKKGRVLASFITPEKATSSLEGVAKLFMASIFFSVAYFIFLAMINVEMGSPDFDSLSRPELIYGLFSASVYEEFISRVLLVGVPLVIAGLIQKRDKPFLKIFGGGLGLTPLTLALITFSSLMFAFAHVASWDFWKVPQVLITGYALGWAFTRYGLHASILIHFSINLSSSVTEIWPNNAGVEMLMSIFILIWMVAGAYFFIHYLIEFLTKLMPKRLVLQASTAPPPVMGYAPPPPPHWQQMQYQPPPPTNWQYPQGTVPPPPRAYDQPQQPPPARPIVQPPPQRPQPAGSGGFVCPNCSSTGASYDAGKLTCMKCGSVHVKEQPVEKKEEKQQIEF
ncbi:MAG: CPBP family glutamic-type intramembrane protease [Thermoplasmata archaeon]|nr:CPBP family glutamic-type intramembrane protease [Thermoplasmata archaeon]